MVKTRHIMHFITPVIILSLLLMMLLLIAPLSAMAGTIAGSFTTLASSPMNITCFTVDPTTGLMYGQGDRSTNYYKYDYSTNTWSTLAACPVNSGNNGGATYMNGKIYNSYCSLTTMTVYDIASNTWSTIAGGLQTGNIANDGTDIYISASGTFKKWDISATAWVSLTATTTQSWGGLEYKNGYFYSHDGNGSTPFKRYNISSDTWENLTAVPGGAVLGSAIFDAYYYCMGSYGGTNLYSYDLGAAEWNNTLTLPFTINDTSIVVYNNSLYIAQGEAGTGFTRFTPNNPILSSIEGTSIAYTIGDAATVITSTIVGTDNDDTNFESGTVSITGNFESGKDVLAFVDQNGISGSWNSTTGILTLTGTATIANWNTALRSVTYSNDSLASTENTRTVSFQVNDGDQNSNVQSRDIILTVPAPEMSIEGNSTEIADGDSSPSSDDHTDFGSVYVSGSTLVRTFTIRNTGTADLTLSGTPIVAVSGTHAAEFTVSAQPLSGTISASGSTTFQVTFDPGAEGVRTATISIANNDSNENPYNFVIQGTGQLNVLTVSGITASNKVYDGTAAATLDTGSASLVGVVGGDTVDLSTVSAAGAFADANVGAGKTVTVSGLTISGADAASYTLTQPTATADITARAITVTAATDSKVYDGTTGSSGTPTITSGSLAPGDSVTWTQTFDNKNVGTGKTLTPAGTVSDGNSGNNYSVTYTADVTGEITARAITVTAATDSKTYDGTTSSSGTPTITSGSLAPGDSVTWTQTFDNKNVGTGKTLTPAGTVSDGNSGNNYSVTYTADVTGEITAKAITVTAATDSKVYDGTTGSSGTPTITSGSLASGDSVTWTQTFDNKNVGTGKTLTPAGTVSDGNSGNNYSVTYAAVATGEITARAITVTAATDSKVYDGTTGSSGTPTITSGSLASGDSVTWTQTFDNKNVGTGKTLTPAGTVSDGNSGNNYSVTYTAVVTGEITAKELTVSGITAYNKVYDSNTNATLDTSSAALVGIVGGDSVSLNTASASGTFADASVGSSKTVTVSGLTISGTDAGNYTLTQPTTTADIIAVPTGGSGPLPPYTEPAPEPEPEPQVIAEINTETEPATTDSNGNSPGLSGHLITVSEEHGTLVINIPVVLDADTTLDSFTDASGLTFENNRLVIPAASTPLIMDETGDIGTSLIIETGDCVGMGDKACAEVLSIKTSSGYTSQDFSSENPSLGEVTSTVNLELNTLPVDAQVEITTSLEIEPGVSSAFQLAAGDAGLGDITVAYTLNIEKTNIENGSDIESATITMVVGPDWVAANGGIDAIKIIRYDPETGTQQVLETNFLGYDEQGRAMFEGISPDGLSVFGLAGLDLEESVQEPLQYEPETSVNEPEIPAEELETPAEESEIPSEESEAPVEEPDETNNGWIVGLVAGIVVVLAAGWFFIVRRRKQE